MADKVSAWSAADGTLFLVEQDAKDHDFRAALVQWSNQFSGPDVLTPTQVDFCVGLMIENRTELLRIFKILNGGSPIVAPTPQPDRQPADIVELKP